MNNSLRSPNYYKLYVLQKENLSRLKSNLHDLKTKVELERQDLIKRRKIDLTVHRSFSDTTCLGQITCLWLLNSKCTNKVNHIKLSQALRNANRTDLSQ